MQNSSRPSAPAKAMARLKLIVAYDGTNFAGWQSQSRGNTIQDKIENAFKRVVGARVRLHGAGRTDAGVHALAQCAHVDLAEKKFPETRWPSALNAFLPPEIRIVRCQYVGAKFHARFSARGKIYRYRIWNAPVLSPFENGRAWHVTRALDIDAMSRAAKFFVGEHNFACFAANRGQPPRSTIRTIHSAKIKQSASLISVDFDGDGFLYKMVRLMAGALVNCGLGKSGPEFIAEELRRSKPRRPVTAPAAGLFLVRIRY